MLSSLEKHESCEVYNDVYFTPTSIDYLMESIDILLRCDYSGIIHIAGRDKVSRYEFALKIARAFGYPLSLISGVKQPSEGSIAKDSSLSANKLNKIADKQDYSLEKHLDFFSENLLKPYFRFSDDRGEISGIFQDKNWREINYLQSKKGCQRGGHYHRKTQEAFYIIEGKIKILLRDVKTKKEREFIAEKGDIFEIPINAMHTFDIIENSSWINMLSIPMKGDHKDFHKEES